MSKFFAYFLLLIYFILAADTDNPSIDLYQDTYGSLKPNEQAFYQVTVPELTDVDNYMYFRAMENEALDQIEGIISDPNIFISRKNQKPNSKETAEFYSDKFGEEVITVPDSEFKEGTVFYIGIKCEKKCNYQLIVKLRQTVTIDTDKSYIYPGNSNEFIRLKFKTPANFSYIFVSTDAKGLSPYRLYVTDNDFTINNALETKPISYNGYRVEINKNEIKDIKSEYYCLIQNYGKNNRIQIIVFTDNHEIDLEPYEPFDDVFKSNEERCYEVPVETSTYDKPFILQIHSNYGNSQITAGGWKCPKDLDKSKVKTFDITNSRILKFSSNDMKFFGEPDKSKQYDKFHFCIKSLAQMSLNLQAFQLHTVNKHQDLNYIYPGQPFDSILPPKELTKISFIYYNERTSLYVKLNSNQENIQLYLYYCNEKNCTINSDFFTNSSFDKEHLLDAKREVNFQHISVHPSNNICLNKDDKNKIKNCKLVAIVRCFSETEDCIYKVTVQQKQEETQLKPRQPFYTMIAPNSEDAYEFFIKETDVHSIFIIFNLQSGNSTMSVYKYESERSDIKTYFKEEISDEKRVSNAYYLPHVVIIDQSKISKLNGRYYISIKSSSFSSYSIYFYYFLKNGENPDSRLDTAIALSNGQIIEDFFYYKQPARLYSFENTATSENKRNVIISFVPLNSQVEAYVFKNIGDIKFKPTENKAYAYDVEGYAWKSEFSDQIIIKTSDINYIEYGQYYILMVNQDNNKESESSSYIKSSSSFTVSAMLDGDRLFLTDSVEHRFSLSNDIKSQKYIYMHSDPGIPLLITVNSFNGGANLVIKINNKETVVDVNLVSYRDSSYYKTISAQDLKRNCEGTIICPVMIEFKMDSSYSFSYLIVCKSNKMKEEILYPGIEKEAQILTGESQRYVVDVKPEEEGARITLKIISGEITAYAKKDNRKDLTEEISWPNKNDFEYKAVSMDYDIYSIYIPGKDLKKDQSTVRVFITVVGGESGYRENMCKYSLLYSNVVYTIKPNIQYDFIIYGGETQMFTFNIENPEVKDLYITMSNKKGDANLYLNYGKTYPTLKSYTWKSKGAYTESLHVSSKDLFFTEKKEEYISGTYSLLIYGHSFASYSLYLSINEIKMQSISKGETKSCKCENQFDACYFKYEVYNNFDIKELSKNEIIFSLNSIYGDSMSLYAKLYKNGDQYEIEHSLPSETDYDWKDISYSRVASSNIIFAEVAQTNPKLTVDSQIVIKAQCKMKSLFDFTAGNTYDKKYQEIFISLGDKQIYSIDVNDTQTYIMNMYQKKDINFELIPLFGSIKGVIYTSDYDDVASVYSTFEADESQKSILNRISYEKIGISFIHMNITAKSSNKSKVYFIFKAEYDEQWIRVPLGQALSYSFGDEFHGYFDLLPEYNEVEVSIRSISKEERPIRVMTKLNYFKTEDLNDFTYVYSIPSETNYDHLIDSSSVLPIASFVVNKLSNETKQAINTAKVLFTVKYLTPKTYSENNIEVVITPNVENYRRMYPYPYTYYMNSIQTDKILYKLKKLKPEHNMFAVEISSCKGDFEYIISDKLYYKHEKPKSTLENQEKYEFGKSTITVKNIGDNESIYLYISPKSEEKQPVDFIVSYHSILADSFSLVNSPSIFNYTILNKNSVIISLPEFKLKDSKGNYYKKTDFEYTLVVTQNYNDFLNLGSLCYMSNLKKESHDFDYVKSRYLEEDNTIIISNLHENEKYYFNVLAKNKPLGTYFAFSPAEVEVKYVGQKFSWLLIGLCVVGVLFFAYLSFVFYRKYRKTHTILKYEENDIRNMGNIPKSFDDIKKIELSNQKQKFTGLAEDISGI